jgi:hypothetical protein
MRHLLLRLILLTLALTTPALLRAQSVATITGTVTDTTGAVVPDANIELINAATSTSYKGTTNSAGSYTITNVKPGPGYKVTFSRAGFESVVISGLYLNVDATRTQNASLPVGTTSSTVEVSASSENVTLNTTDATVGNNFEVQFINDLPISNRDSPAALFTQQPGVTLDGAVTGARVDQTNISVDGLDVNDNATGQFGVIVGNAPVDSIQEFRGVTAGQLSSAGEGGGGQFELVTRSGTNQFHGSAVEYHRDANLEANDWFNNNAGVGRPPLIRNQFGGNIGGPVLKNKLFFFFDYAGRRDTLSNFVERTVPINAFRNGQITYVNNAGGNSTLSSAQVAALDPQGVGFNAALLSLINSRYPVANDLSGAVGDLLNTAGYRFNAPFPYTENDYVGRVDYNLTSTMKLFGRVTFTRTNETENPIQFPGDPQTFPFLDKSYAWVVGHTWTIGSNKVNQATYGETYENYAFPNTYNPTGITQYLYGGNGSGGTILDGAYASAVNAQFRTYPVPVIKDDFSWQKGAHSLSFGGTFKYINPDGNTILDYNSPLLGLGGNTPALSPNLRPADIDSSTQTGPVSAALYDAAFALALGHYASVTSTFNYDSAGNSVPQGTGSQQDFRYYETELYVGDTWKVTPKFTVSYGLRWQNYSVPYEKHGLESVANVSFDQLFAARIAQSAAGQSGDLAVPFMSYALGGKANNAPGFFNPDYKNFAPRFAFAYSSDPKTVFNGGAGIIYDHTVINAVQYQQSQYSYLFQSSATTPFGVAGNPTASLQSDPRFSGLTNPPPPPAAPPITNPFVPFVSGTGTNASPFGLLNGQAFNETIDKNLKTPYSISFNVGVQHEFPQGFILKVSYVGRLGRRLLGQADANQLIDFPDTISGQLYSAAFASLTQQLRAGVDPMNVAVQPWYENINPGFYNLVNAYNAANGTPTNYTSNSQYVAASQATYVQRGDFADTTQAISAAGLLPPNVGMGAQFSENTFYTNKGFSGYNGLLTTLHKNAGYGLQFDVNYTWSHSIDNVSLAAITPALGGYGFICDALRPRECRANSDFDVTHYISGNFVYDLPFGRGRSFAANAPTWLNEVIGGWGISGIPSWHSGNAYEATSNAFVAGYANDAPAILVGQPELLKSHLNKSNGTLYAYSNPTAAQAAFTGPVGFQIGSRNNLRGPQYFDFDMGLGKTFPVWEKVNLKFRTDAFNVFNHPNFYAPSASQNTAANQGVTSQGGNITSNLFGVISNTVPSSSDNTSNTARVLQVSLRLEF